MDSDDLRKLIPGESQRCSNCNAVLRRCHDPSTTLCDPCRRAVEPSSSIYDEIDQFLPAHAEKRIAVKAITPSEETIEQLEARLRLAGAIQ